MKTSKNYKREEHNRFTVCRILIIILRIVSMTVQKKKERIIIHARARYGELPQRKCAVLQPYELLAAEELTNPSAHQSPSKENTNNPKSTTETDHATSFLFPFKV